MDNRKKLADFSEEDIQETRSALLHLGDGAYGPEVSQGTKELLALLADQLADEMDWRML